MTVVLKFHGFARDSHAGRQYIGQYIKSCDFEACKGMGSVEFTADINEAIQFETVYKAIDYIRRTPACRPKRPDGKPNRPLTASHLELVTVK